MPLSHKASLQMHRKTIEPRIALPVKQPTSRTPAAKTQTKKKGRTQAITPLPPSPDCLPALLLLFISSTQAANLRLFSSCSAQARAAMRARAMNRAARATVRSVGRGAASGDVDAASDPSFARRRWRRVGGGDLREPRSSVRMLSSSRSCALLL